MHQTIVTIVGVVGLLLLIQLGRELSTDMDFSLRSSHSARDFDRAQAGAAARRSRATDPTAPLCVQP